MWMKNEERVTISKESVLEEREQSTVTTVEGLGSNPRYILLATGPVYSNPKKTNEITTVYGTEQYCYITTGYEVKPLTTEGDVYYKNDGTNIRIIYTIPSGGWVDTLPKMDKMQEWGNPAGTIDNKIDAELIEKLTADDTPGAAWSGSQEQPYLQALAVILNRNPRWQHINKDESFTRFQTAKFD